MILADMHTHTRYSHGASTPEDMYAAAVARGLTCLAFTEHSPRPVGFDYTHEYREHLTRHLPDYVREVRALRDGGGACEALLGMEMDWLDGQEDFTRAACAACDYDVLLGSVHFIGRWGFDDGDTPWKSFSQEECDRQYQAYFEAWERMIRSGLFHVASHPDLVKIFSVEQFHVWLSRPESMDLVRRGLTALRDAGMCMEISSAGLRKPCGEIYPAAPIMSMAAQLALPITFASDAHCVNDVAHGFDRLASYARSFGFREYTVVRRGHKIAMPF
ncbi:MAG: histidinol-phosphatase [Desulfovibrio sp.]|nr:histidinol-phosphatase [Desulfovibrio sp.]